MGSNSRGKVSAVALVVLALVALGAYGLDQFSKFLVVSNLSEGEVVPVLGNVLQLQFVRNPGAAFSLASGQTWIFTIIATAVIVFIIWFARRIRSIAWAIVFGLLLGGVMGNLTDRYFRDPGFPEGHVIDFIYTPWMLPAIYNFADIAIVCSMGLFMILTLRGVGLDGVRTIEPKKNKQDSSNQKDDGAAAASTDEVPAP
ncbi:signal peptidase II [Microterricola gilva]|uniref:Lipoprotein signal peptidase n=1 Tax=Microterricola gilva TaxID=393267 RepID=A0A4Q8ANC5_9MICO|nr:signal peptidase II [Microterricola gilva]RZU65475.1 signal peptidase II [Microterricola gilva]